MIRRVGLVLVIAALVVTAGASAGTLVAPQESTSLDTVDSVQDNDTDTGDNETDTNETDVGDNETDTGDNETDTGNETDQAQQEQRLTFDDQESNGSTVVVQEVEMEEDGFLVIHGGIGIGGDSAENVLGVSHYLESGTHQNVTIHLHDEAQADGDTEVVVGGTQDNETDTAGDETDTNETDTNETDTNETDTNETDTTQDNETDTNETDTNETDTTGDNETDTTGDNETDTTGDNETDTTDTNETDTTGDNATDTGNETDTGTDETTLVAMVHADDNDNQQFDFAVSGGEVDTPVEGGATATATVTIVDRLSEERANVEFNDQTLGGQAGDTGADTTGNESDTGNETDTTGDDETDTNETDTNETDTTGNESDTNETDTTGNESDTNETDTTGDNETETGNETAGTAQAVEEGTVTVDSVTLTRPGYVVLMDDRGNIVGVSEYLEPETHENLEIELTRSVLATSSPDGNTTVTMTATLHMETTNNQVFEYPISNDVDVPYENIRSQEVSDTAEIAIDTGEEDAETDTGNETDTNETDTTGNETDTTGDESDGNETDTTDDNETDTNESDTNESDS